MILEPSQIHEFGAFGFLILRDAFTPREIERIVSEYESGLALVGSIGLEPVGVRGQRNWSNLRLGAPTLCTLPEDERLGGVAEQLLGADAFAIHCNSNQFCGHETEWHPDAPVGFRGIKFALYLQPLAAATGALRVIPGSHLPCFAAALTTLGLKGANVGDDRSYLRGSARTVADIPCYVCDTKPGDVIVFDVRIWHASWGGSDDRRLVSSDFHAYPTTADQVAAELAFRDAHRQSMQTFRSPQPQYSAEWLANRDGNPRRARWIDTLRHFGYLQPLETGLAMPVAV
jgi:hypothetical protein